MYKRQDEYARDLLEMMAPKFKIERLGKFEGEDVMIAGGAACIKKEMELFEEADRIIAVSTAADVLLEEGIEIDIMVTDLDKNPNTSVELSKMKIPVAVAAHGDNVQCLEKWVPKCNLDYVMGTTQTKPKGAILNYGGFTDGDRAAFLADSLGAKKIIFAGWDFDDKSIGIEKKRKLEWAEFLLRLLEDQRGEKFNVLRGR